LRQVSKVPTQTFFNLPQQKRQRVLDAAVNEFAANSFDNASIARIVDDAQIPRGSFYQYFDDLEDLYRYLFEKVGERKTQYLTQAVGQQTSTMEQIRGMYVAALQFASENPRLAALGMNFLREEPQFRRKMYHNFEETSVGFLRDLLVRGRQKGDIDAEVDVDMAAFVLHSLSIAVMEYYFEREQNPEKVFEDGRDYLQLIEKVLYIMENGITRGKDTPEDDGVAPE